MKRIIFYMLCLCVLFTPLAVSAGAPEEEIGDLAHEIVVTVNQQSFLELKEAITVSTLDLSGAFKIFVDTNIFEVPSNKISDIQKALDDGDYI